MKSQFSSLFIAAFVIFSLTATSALAADPFGKEGSTAVAKTTKTSFAPSGGLDSQGGTTPLSSARAGGAEALVFTSPPRETAIEGQKIYGPVAEYLSKAIGKKVIYRHPGTWGAYRSEMLRGDYDIVFDGPHFISYRAEKLNHNALVKLPGRLDFAIVTLKNEKYESVAQMGGRTFCAHAPPNLATLMLLSQFNNPARQPAIMTVEGWDNVYKGVVTKKCVGAVIPIAALKKLDKDEQLKVILKTRSMPNQGFSAGPRVTPDDQTKITLALISPDATASLEKLMAASKVSDKLLAANNTEYAGIGEVLRAEFGYY